MSGKPDLKVVGEIKPPAYRDPVQMLRNLAEQIENSEFGDVATVAVATFGDTGVEIFGGGRDSDAGSISLCFQAACAALVRPLLDHKA